MPMQLEVAMPTGERPSPTEELYITSIQEAATPSKQLELVEKRSTWVFGAVGTVGTALAGFTLLAGSQSLLRIYPPVGVLIVLLTLLALALAASTLMIKRKEVNPNDISEAQLYFHSMVSSRARRATWAIGALTAAILIAGGAATLSFLARDTSSVSLEWQQGAEGPTLSVAVTLKDIDPGREVVAELTATAKGGAQVLYTASAKADESGSISIDGEVPAPEGSSRATLIVSEIDDQRAIPIEQASVDIPPTQSSPAAKSIDTIVGSTVVSLSDFWTSELTSAGLDEPASKLPMVVPFDSTLGQLPPPCGTGIDLDEVTNNAFYCQESNTIAWDRNLMRQLYPTFGQYAVAAVVAHEWAHWVQSQIGTLSGPRVELQADCLAGVWGGYEEAGGSDALDFQPADRADAIVALQWYVGVPKESSNDQLKRNPGFSAFLNGANDGLAACQAYGP
jgi:hypothetical protein